MVKKLSNKTNFWIAITSFILAFIFLFQDGRFHILVSFIWLISFVLNLNVANKKVHEKER